MKVNSCGLFVALGELSRSQRDTNRLLHTLEDARSHVWLMAFWRAVHHPDFGTGLAQSGAPFPKAPTIEKPRHCDETDDALLVFVWVTGCGVITRAKHLPCRPTPKIDVEVLQ